MEKPVCCVSFETRRAMLTSLFDGGTSLNNTMTTGGWHWRQALCQFLWMSSGPSFQDLSTNVCKTMGQVHKGSAVLHNGKFNCHKNDRCWGHTGMAVHQGYATGSTSHHEAHEPLHTMGWLAHIYDAFHLWWTSLNRFLKKNTATSLSWVSSYWWIQGSKGICHDLLLALCCSSATSPICICLLQFLIFPPYTGYRFPKTVLFKYMCWML